jgi:hypothetical protein
MFPTCRPVENYIHFYYINIYYIVLYYIIIYILYKYATRYSEYTSFIIILHIKCIQNKLYHDKNAKHVSWTKVARASIKDFDEFEDIFKSVIRDER